MSLPSCNLTALTHFHVDTHLNKLPHSLVVSSPVKCKHPKSCLGPHRIVRHLTHWPGSNLRSKIYISQSMHPFARTKDYIDEGWWCRKNCAFSYLITADSNESHVIPSTLPDNKSPWNSMSFSEGCEKQQTATQSSPFRLVSWFICSHFDFTTSLFCCRWCCFVRK